MKLASLVQGSPIGWRVFIIRNSPLLFSQFMVSFNTDRPVGFYFLVFILHLFPKVL